MRLGGDDSWWGLEHPMIARPKGGKHQPCLPPLSFREDVMDFTNHSQKDRAESKKAADPVIRRQCICRNGHKPVDGSIYTSPACLEHGLRSPPIVHDGQSDFEVAWGDDRPNLESERLAGAVAQCKKRLFANSPANL